ncbi:MAG TPA: glycoside hydrolase family 44 protein [Rudaea sp.]|jgi:hypothetical protein|nr:glycoside hydrolase family 44 protein [Rudaea sp.]
MRVVVAIALGLTVSSALAAPIAVSVDATLNVHPFSPLIFGVAYGDATQNAKIGYTVRRWGGNSTTRYNWMHDIHNTADDFYFENVPDSTDHAHTPPLDNSADAFVTGARNGGAQPLIAIPTIGLKPLDNSALDHPLTVGFSVAKYGAQEDVDSQYDPNAGNGVRPDGTPITGNSASDTSDAAPPSYEASWIAHLQSVFGTAANGGVKFYSLDNEVMLWNSTHRDVHPIPPTYDEIWSKAMSYAAAIKTQEPNAQVTGPVTWGYPDLFTSAADAASCNCFSGDDRGAHGGMPFVAWYLQQVSAHPMTGGVPLVDYLDLHYYPQDPDGASGAIYSHAEDSATVGRRMRSLKELYDPTWTSESWIGTVDGTDGDDVPWHYTKPNLIPRVKAWINQYATGTKLAITEYAWDREATVNNVTTDTVSGGVAQAEVLGIFARENVDLATRWEAPIANGFSERAFRLFLNYDGAGAKVQGNSVAATTASIDQIGAYAFHDARRLMVLLTNKDTVAHDVTVTLNAPLTATWTLYGFDKTHDIHVVASHAMTTKTLTLTALPAMSANMLVIPDVDEIFANGFE